MTKQFGTNPIAHNLHKVVYGFNRISEELLQDSFALTFSQFRILLAVKWKPELSQADIAEYHNLTPAAVSRQIDILLNKQLITKTENKINRREHALMLSPSGKQLMEKAMLVLNKAFTEIYTVLTSEEQKIMEFALQKLAERVCKKEGRA